MSTFSATNFTVSDERRGEESGPVVPGAEGKKEGLLDFLKRKLDEKEGNAAGPGYSKGIQELVRFHIRRVRDDIDFLPQDNKVLGLGEEDIASLIVALNGSLEERKKEYRYATVGDQFKSAGKTVEVVAIYSSAEEAFTEGEAI